MNWYKYSQLVDKNLQQTETNIGSPHVNIRPYEPLIVQAVDELKSANPGIFNNITDINVDLGFGQYGSVQSNSPNSINLNMNKIKNEVTNKIGENFNLNNPQHKAAILFVIKQTIIHELAHISGFNPETGQFAPESVAENVQNQWVNSNQLF